jgi:glycerol-3-phosphate responsive antiterminator
MTPLEPGLLPQCIKRLPERRDGIVSGGDLDNREEQVILRDR